MKAAKDGQDNQECEMVFSACVSQRSPDDSVPMMTTYNEINKLVQARNAKRLLQLEEEKLLNVTEAVSLESTIAVNESTESTRK